MAKTWRSENFEELVDARIKKVNEGEIISIGIRDNFEAGFDACLEALKQKGEYILDGLNPDDKGGWLTFIPDDEAD